MKTFAYLGTIAVLGISVAAGAATPEAQLLAPIRLMVDSFNKGDMKTAATAVAPAGIVIIDDAPPHVWAGPDAFESWSKALEAADQTEGITDDLETNGKPTRVVVNEDRGYVVLPAVYTFKRKGVAMREVAQIVYTLQKGASGWLVTGFSWVGTKPKPMTDAPK
jgi:hypothetical protein